VVELDLPDVVNDLDVDFTENPIASAAYRNDQRNIRKVTEATKALNVDIIHPLREGKKLLVLDIDYSASRLRFRRAVRLIFTYAAILDTKPLTSGSLPPAECARPHLHEFLEAIYPYYDSECPWFTYVANETHPFSQYAYGMLFYCRTIMP
jgi:ubiquitin-like domain-containing CTD phosphatase 1